MKKVLIAGLIMLTGCGMFPTRSHEEVVREAQQEYVGLDCEQLIKERESLERLKQEVSSLTIDVYSKTRSNESYSKYDKNGRLKDNWWRYEDPCDVLKSKIRGYDLKLEAISGLMQQKECHKKK